MFDRLQFLAEQAATYVPNVSVFKIDRGIQAAIRDQQTILIVCHNYFARVNIDNKIYEVISDIELIRGLIDAYNEFRTRIYKQFMPNQLQKHQRLIPKQVSFSSSK